ncbi:MAG: hypothetical protein GXO79_04165 [Chlorobi bacterium]|nr:hypothetical protein [Chlorobiota bacterium]
MTGKLKNILLFTISLIITALLGFLIYKIIDLLFENFSKINPNIVVAIIAGTVTITGYFITRYFEKKKIIEQQIREQKLPVYEEFIDFLFSIFKQTKNNKQINDKKLEEFFWSMNKKSILWLSDKTLKSYVTWKKLTSSYADVENKTEYDNLIIMTSLENLLKDFREDIGHKNKNIVEGDILSLFINDWGKINTKE